MVRFTLLGWLRRVIGRPCIGPACRVDSTQTDDSSNNQRGFNPVRFVLDLPACVKLGALAYLVMVLSGCAQIAPPRTPDHLDATPGPPAVVTTETYTNTRFHVDYPDDWRVITSAAFAPPHVVLVAPDESAVIAVAVDAEDAENPTPTTDEPLRRETRTVTLENGRTVTAALAAPRSAWTRYRRMFDSVVGSLRPADAL